MLLLLPVIVLHILGLCPLHWTVRIKNWTTKFALLLKHASPSAPRFHNFLNLFLRHHQVILSYIIVIANSCIILYMRARMLQAYLVAFNWFNFQTTCNHMTRYTNSLTKVLSNVSLLIIWSYVDKFHYKCYWNKPKKELIKGSLFINCFYKFDKTL